MILQIFVHLPVKIKIIYTKECFVLHSCVEICRFETCIRQFFIFNNARRLSSILSLAYDINFILPRAHTLILLMSCYDEKQGSELSWIRLNRVPLKRHREWSLEAGGSRKIKAKYGRWFFSSKQAITLN